MFSSLHARKTLPLSVFGVSVPYPDAKRMVPQWIVVALNSLVCLHSPVWQDDSKSIVIEGNMPFAADHLVDAATAPDPAVTLASHSL